MLVTRWHITEPLSICTVSSPPAATRGLSGPEASCHAPGRMRGHKERGRKADLTESAARCMYRHGCGNKKEDHVLDYYVSQTTTCSHVTPSR